MSKALPPSKFRTHHYHEPKRGEWVQPIRRGYKLACCDCGLVHRVDFRIAGRRVQFRVFRDNRATAAMRREARRRQERA